MTAPYRPSNGTEGMLFMHQFCDRCIHDKPARESRYEDACQVLAFALAFDVHEPEYPPELVSDGPVGGTCTKFEQDPDEPAYDPVQPPPFSTPAHVLRLLLEGDD